MGTHKPAPLTNDESPEGPPLPPRSVLNRPLPPEPTRRIRTNGTVGVV